MKTLSSLTNPNAFGTMLLKQVMTTTKRVRKARMNICHVWYVKNFWIWKIKSPNRTKNQYSAWHCIRMVLTWRTAGGWQLGWHECQHWWRTSGNSQIPPACDSEVRAPDGSSTAADASTTATDCCCCCCHLGRLTVRRTTAPRSAWIPPVRWTRADDDCRLFVCVVFDVSDFNISLC